MAVHKSCALIRLKFPHQITKEITNCRKSNLLEKRCTSRFHLTYSFYKIEHLVDIFTVKHETKVSTLFCIFPLAFVPIGKQWHLWLVSCLICLFIVWGEDSEVWRNLSDYDWIRNYFLLFSDKKNLANSHYTGKRKSLENCHYFGYPNFESLRGVATIQ